MRSVETMKVGWRSTTDHIPELRRLHCPALGIVGSTAAIAVELMERTVAAIPNVRLEIVPDSFETTNLCQPKTFNRLLREFLEQGGGYE